MKPGTNYTFQIFKGAHINAVLSAKDVDFIANSTVSEGYYFWISNMKVSAEEHHSSTLLRLAITPTSVSVFNEYHTKKVIYIVSQVMYNKPSFMINSYITHIKEWFLHIENQFLFHCTCRILPKT